MLSFLRFWTCAAAALGLIAPLGGCATMARGTTETFVVETLPGDATVTTSFGGVCRASPCAFLGVSREAEFTVRIERAGYQTQVHRVSHRLAGGGVTSTVGNVLFPVASTVAFIVDATNGATQQLNPNPLRITLQPEPR